MSPKNEKPHLNLAIIGHIDHGKSTLMGHLLVLTGAVTDREQRELEKIAKDLDRESWKFAYFMDNLAEERKRGITIDLSFRKFETDSKYFTIIDAPGHADFVKNMITGASQADAAILVVSGKTSEFGSGIGEKGQTREHAFLAKTLGVKQLIVAINKADDASFNYDEDRFNECKEELSKLLTTVGYKVDDIPFIPVSALTGDNLNDSCDKMSWYKGPTLLEALDKLEVPEKPTEKDLRLPVQDVYKIKGAGVVPVGRVETGVLNVNDKIIVMPGEFKGEVRSIEMHHEAIQKAEPGDNIGFNIRGATMKDLHRGDVVSLQSSPCNVVIPGQALSCQVIVIWHPTAVAIGYTPVVHAHTAQVACKFTELSKKIDPRSGQVVEDNPQYLKKNDAAIVKLSPIKKMCMEKYKDFPELGRLAVRDMGRTVAVGVVLDIVDNK
ncbi:MAG: translation elongation factor EF-1 subunit alpha [Candidatus Lokiarchaeota archaeon]|nr:translation elongation factor EF-1 subunit alpha [Candidatus Lokiarchaeota archaeon]